MYDDYFYICLWQLFLHISLPFCVFCGCCVIYFFYDDDLIGMNKREVNVEASEDNDYMKYFS